MVVLFFAGKGRGFWVAVRCWSCSGVDVVFGCGLVLLLTICWKTQGVLGSGEGVVSSGFFGGNGARW
uniref:Putative ovule protein n=1 Tax=Solanum chacoense TaxID=4108 RepID=A0A0V0H354_SOLCH